MWEKIKRFMSPSEHFAAVEVAADTINKAMEELTTRPIKVDGSLSSAEAAERLKTIQELYNSYYVKNGAVAKLTASAMAIETWDVDYLEEEVEEKPPEPEIQYNIEVDYDKVRSSPK